MKFTLRLPIPSVKKPLKQFKIDKSFKVKTEVTDRTIKVGEAFGVGVDDEQTHQVFKDFKVEVKPGDIVYITGESGSGKSTLLRLLAEALNVHGQRTYLNNSEQFGEVVVDSQLDINPDEVLVEGVGSDVNDALKALSLAGLNDAFLFVRRFKELSDGQKYRYKIAKMLASSAGVWVLDEFAAALDRETAKIVAFSLQKTARRNGKTVIVATTHQDLFEDLAPSVSIWKGWGEEVNVKYQPNTVNTICSIARDVTIRQGTFQDYKKLSYLHYRSGKPFGPRKVFVMELAGRLIGCIIYSTPMLAAAGRNKFLGHRATPQEVNSDFLTISRVILHPKFRSIGLGSQFVRDTLPLSGSRYVETIAIMAKYNPFFSHAGMLEIPVESEMSRVNQKLLEALKVFRFNPVFCGSKHYNQRVIEELTDAEYCSLVDLISRKARFIVSKQVLGSEKTVPLQEVHNRLEENHVLVAEAVKVIAVSAQTKKYYVWSMNTQPEGSYSTNLGNNNSEAYSSVDASEKQQHPLELSQIRYTGREKK